MCGNVWRHGAGTALLFLSWLLAAPAMAAAENLAPQVSREGAVTVKVTPLALAGGAELWSFEIVLDSHVVDLGHDMTAVTRLVDGDGEFAPLGWEGDGPGGHHRKGVVTFKPLRPEPASLTLKIRHIGSVAERSFTWSTPSP